jgi:hypothetical protein
MENATTFSQKTRREQTTEYLVVDKREIRCEHMDWVPVYDRRSHWWVIVNTVMNLRVP